MFPNNNNNNNRIQFVESISHPSTQPKRKFSGLMRAVIDNALKKVSTRELAFRVSTISVEMSAELDHDKIKETIDLEWKMNQGESVKYHQYRELTYC